MLRKQSQPAEVLFLLILTLSSSTIADGRSNFGRTHFLSTTIPESKNNPTDDGNPETVTEAIARHRRPKSLPVGADATHLPDPVRTSADPFILPASSETGSNEIWIKTIKGIAIVWAVAAVIWAVCRILVGCSFCCELWLYRRSPVLTSHRLPTTLPLDFSSDEFVIIDSQLTLTGFADNDIEDHARKFDAAPPEYSAFLPPTYDEIIQSERKLTAV